jgi:hypothetical protein
VTRQDIEQMMLESSRDRESNGWKERRPSASWIENIIEALSPLLG